MIVDSELHILEAYLQDRMPFYLDLLRQMVAINSFSANVDGVNHLGRLTAAIFAEFGFEIEFVHSRNAVYGNHLILTRPGRTQRKIGLVSHLDTVFPAIEERQNNFAWREEGDRIYGPGTVDIKGGTVVIYMILDAIRRLAPDAFEDITWLVLLDASEEADGQHFGELCQERLDQDSTLACLVFEGGFVNQECAHVVTARKGMAVYRVTTEGKASHAGSSHPEGANAIVQIAQTIQEIAGWTDYERKLTFNVGTVAGGTVVNRVPHFASTFVEMRTFAPEVYQEGLAKMMALPGRARVTSGNGRFTCKVNVEIVRTMPPWPRNAATDRLAAIWQEAGNALGIHVEYEERGGLSDGNYLCHHVPTLDGLGPSGNNAHCSEHVPEQGKEQEYVAVSSFIPKAMLNIHGVLKLIEQADD